MSIGYRRLLDHSVKVPLLVAWGTVVLLLAPVVAPAATKACQGTAVAKVNGMACPFCAYGLKKHLLEIPGVKNVQVDLEKSQATIEPGSGSQVTDAEIQRAISDAGFAAGQIQCEAMQESTRSRS